MSNPHADVVRHSLERFRGGNESNEDAECSTLITKMDSTLQLISTPTLPRPLPGREGNRSATLTLKGQPLVDAWLAEQHLTAVERFAQKHGRGDLPAQAKYYRELIPLTKPAAGQQYAFDVDLDACTGCKACVAACHNMNGLDDDEAFRDVGLLVGGSLDLPVMQHVTSACHHCLEPACLHGCPVNAYEKDEVTGIVKHLDDQCIGCQYCVFKCPYDVPKYNRKRGIVRKCDMCSDRLAIGEAPACVQACPNQAIRISIVDRAKVIEDAEVNVFLPGAPEPDYTLPTTNYRTKRVLPRNLLPADYHGVAPQHVHVPLVAMLVLTQLSVGAFLVERVIGEWLGSTNIGGAMQSIVALALGLLAVAASTLHLGRPRYAFRAVIGLRTSWLSREIVGFGLFAAAAATYACVTLFFGEREHAALRSVLNTAVLITGLLGVFCSAMLYHDTRRDFWSLGQTGTKFALSMLLLGATTTLAIDVLTSGIRSTAALAARELCIGIAIVSTFKLLFEAVLFRHLRAKRSTPQRRTARLMIGPLARLTACRFACGIFGGIVLPALLVSDAQQTSVAIVPVAIMFVVTLVGELLERTLFFAAVVAPKMPGGPSA